MQRTLAALGEAEKVLQDVLALISAVKKNGAQVDVSELKGMVGECKRVQRVLEVAVRQGDAPAPESGHAKATARVAVNKDTPKVVAAVSQPPKRGREKQTHDANQGKEAEKRVVDGRPKRRVRQKSVVDDEDNKDDEDDEDDEADKADKADDKDDEPDEDDEAEDVVVAARKGRRKKVELEDAAVVPPAPPVKKLKLKNGGVTRGPKGELVFYVAQNGTGAVECPVYGKPQDEPFERRALVPCEFDALEEEEQNWACMQLCQVYADHIKRATRDAVGGPLVTFSDAHAALQRRDGNNGLLFVNEHANRKGANPELMSLVRNARQLFVNAGVCKESIYYMMAAKLHEELSGIVEKGSLTKQFRERLAEMCDVYEIELKPSSLERYLPAGRMMLKCQALAFVNVTLLIDQQKATEKLLERNELRLELSGAAAVAGFGPGVVGPARAAGADRALPKLLEANGDAVTVAGVVSALLKVVCAAAPDNLKATRVAANLSALDFAKVLRMNFGNSGGGSAVNVGTVERYIIWEYTNVVNAKLKSTGVKGWCVAENFRAEVVPKGDWVAVAQCEVGAGLLLNWRDKTVIIHSYEHSDEDTVNAVVKTVAEKLNFPKRYKCEFHIVNGYEDVGLLHWLSQVVWGKGRLADNDRSVENGQDVVCPVELLRLQVAYEFLKCDLVPQGRSFLDLIRESQQVIQFQVESGDKLNVESLMKTGFFVIHGFVPSELCSDEVVLELSQGVKQCKDRQVIFQGAHHNDGRRSQARVSLMKRRSKQLNLLIEAVLKKLKAAVPRRPVHDSEVTAVLSEEGCGPQRTHCDYTRDSLDGVSDDGWCAGLPIGVVVAVQRDTRLDVAPGAVSWDESRFYELRQLVLDAGDAVFFLGNAVHGGAAFVNENVRLHCYVESEEVRMRRLPDSTFFMDTPAGVGNILPRGVKL